MSNQQAHASLKKTLKVSDGIALLIGITIGSGIYATPSIIAGYFPDFSSIFITWIVIGFFVLIGGMIYAELGTRMPHTGGEYVYISRSFGPFAGFMFGWSQLFIIRTSPAAGLALVAADYTEVFIPLSDSAHTLLAISFIFILGLFNYVGIYWASLFQQLTTWMKVLGLMFFALAGFVLLNQTTGQLGDVVEPTQSLGKFGNLIAASMLVLFSYIGWDRVGYVAGEMKNPGKTIPKSLFIGLAFVILIYLAVITLYHYVLGMEGVRGTNTPAADVAGAMLGGSIGAGFIALIAIVSAISSINGTIMSSSRVYYAMAHDGYFFKWLDFIHPKFRTPTRAILAHCVWGTVILLVRGSFATIVSGMVFAILIFYTFTALSLFKFRKEGTGDKASYKLPFYPFLPILYLVGIVGLLVFRAWFEWENSLHDIAFVLTGLPFAWYWVRKKRKNQINSSSSL